MITNDAAFWHGLWGAVVSTALGVLRVFEFRRDQARLGVEPIWERGDVGTQGNVVYSWSAASPALRVINTGRSTIHVTGAGVVRGRWGRGRAAMATEMPGLPAVLDEGKSVRLWVETWMRDPEVRAIVVRDSLGREGRISRKVLKRFLRSSPPTDD